MALRALRRVFAMPEKKKKGKREGREMPPEKLIL
jgi:hypothetical protein